MNSRNARIPDSFDAIAHRFGGQRGFFGDRNIARSGGNDRNFTRPEFGLVAENTDDLRIRVPFGIGKNIADLAVNLGVRARD